MATAKKTAAAPAAAKKTSATSGGRALTVWEQKFASAAEKSAKAEKDSVGGGLQGISLRGGILSVDDAAIPGNELDVVVLAAVHENKWYEGSYDPDTPQIPSCYAFLTEEQSDAEETMAPHEASPNAQGGANGCEDCEHNQWGSAERGNGKACKNVRRLALVTADALASAEDLLETEVRTLNIPVTSVKGWGAYVRNVLAQEVQRPYWAVVTKIKVVPDKKTQFRVVFTFEQLVDFDDALFSALEKRQKEIAPLMTAPYVQIEREEPAPARGRAPARGAPAEKPLKPVGRAAQAMQAAVSRKAAPAPAAKRSKY